MAAILEDFEDATLNLTITGTWARASDFAAVGTSSLKSATITDLQATNAVVTVPTGATSLTFSYRVSSEEDFDKFHVLIDGVEVLTQSGEIDWTPATFNVTGKSQVTFSYTKDESFPSGADAAWVDQIEFTVPGESKSATDSGTLAETTTIVQAPEIAKASSDSGRLVETRWVNEPQASSTPPSIRSTSTASTGSSSYPINAPAGVVADDVLIGIQAADRASTAAMTTPTGGTTWQLLDSLDGISEFGVAQTIRVWWKRAGLSEPGSYTFKQPPSTDGVCLIIAVKDASRSAIPLIMRSTAGTGANVTTPGIVPSSGSDLEIRIPVVRPPNVAVTFTTPAGFTALNRVQSRLYTVVAAAARGLQSNAATAPADFVASTTAIEWRAGFTLAITPAVTGSPQETKTGSDAAAVVESSTVVVQSDGVSKSANDTGTLTETAAATADVTSSDGTTLGEAAAIDAGPGSADQATLAETSLLELGQGSADQARLAESVQVDAQATSIDSGALAETVDIAETIGPISSDHAALTEAATVEVQAAASDIGTLAEAAVVTVVKVASDSGQLVESVSTGLDTSDAAVLIESAAVDAVIAATDSASLAEAAAAAAPKFSTDAAVLVEHAEVADIGRDIVGVGIVRRSWSAHSPHRRWAAGKPRGAWRADSPHT
ncbi:hypothetical protein ACFLIM_39145 [Nonomuraea sp. M3C6]|uniref:Uncharacterized protein n=1 Tax=Nonomuraea marmarensis TaxID=3351344 RepID=A0ABW7APB2_9ACTN